MGECSSGSAAAPYACDWWLPAYRTTPDPNLARGCSSDPELSHDGNTQSLQTRKLA
jgi:hypothetical protein